LLDWIYPPVCASCGEPGYRVCESCRAKIKFIRGEGCLICGGPISKGNSICNECRLRPPNYSAVRSLAVYEGVVRDCIHALKYDNNRGLGEYFAELLGKLFAKTDWQVDFIMPVPLSSKRLAKRGYNQAACIAKPLASYLGIPYHPFGIQHLRDTPSQVGLSAEARRQNVKEAFAAIPEIVVEKRVLVVDDVMTTGATLEACAAVLRAAGASVVYGLTLARSGDHALNID